MKRNFVVSVFGSLVGFVMLFILLSAAGIVGARSNDVIRSDVSQVNSVTAATVTSTFTYQGQLINGGSPVSNICDFQFGLYDALSAGNQIGITQTVSSVSVSRGLFTALLNTGNEFGNTAFNGDARWLSIAVACPSGGSYTPLSPRQQLTSLPFALPGLRTIPNATSPNVIGGYSGNVISPTVSASAIGGGGMQTAPNRVWANYATIGGGFDNIASGDGAFIGGGFCNRAGTYLYSSCLGYGQSGGDTTVVGGFGNQASGYAASIGGGYGNTASGDYATVPGGLLNSATRSYTFAAGFRAKVNHQGTFVWADSTNVDFASTANDQFLVRANGGVGINTNSPASNTLTVSGNGIRIATNGTTIARVQAGTYTSPGVGLAGVNVFTITFPSTFSTVPKISVTPRNNFGSPVNDTFVVTTRSVSTSAVTVNVYRIDNSGGSWGQQLQFDWFAWE